MPTERFAYLTLLCKAECMELHFYKWHLTSETLHIADHILRQIYLMATEGYFPVTYGFFALPTSRLTFGSLVSVQEGHLGKLEHSSLAKSNRRKGIFAIIKTNLQNLTAEFDLRRKSQMLTSNTWEPQPASPHCLGMFSLSL